MGKGLAVSVFLLLVMPLLAFPEGTKQIAPFPAALGWVCIDKSRNDFGSFDAAPEFRININITVTSETINFGLGKNIDTVPVNLKYRLKDPAGNIVLGPLPIPASGKGFIGDWNSAAIGPFPASGGYDPIHYAPTSTGDYVLEFSYPPDSAGFYTENHRIMFRFFDITVVDAAGKPIQGRVWSKAWQFNSGNVLAPPTINRFWGIMYILSDDSIVTSVNCNGFVGGTFSISSNKTGCSTTGNINVDRQSRTGFHTYPQYKIFLSDPDSLIFPTGKSHPGINLPITTKSDCATGSVDLGVKVDKDGEIEVFIDVNPNPGADPRDLKITANVLANPGGNGYNIIHWNGNDGKGAPVKDGTVITATVRYIHGITHLPIYDIEYNDSGYIVSVVRPPGPSPLIYWDDSLIPGNTTVDLTGCSGFPGCHLWDYDIGNNNTINSWWYVTSTLAPSVTFTVKRTPGPPGTISGETNICQGVHARSYSVPVDPDATTYQWSYSGTGATVTGSGATASVTFADTATSGNITVFSSNADCGPGPSSTLPVSIFPKPSVTLGTFDSVCYTALPFLLSGGSPAGGVFRVNGVSSAMFDPVAAGPGLHTVVYSYTDAHGCVGADSTTVFIKTGKECEIVIWVPNAFSPNGDGLNDHFRPASANIRKYNMIIFDRSGLMVYSSDNISDGWDGTYGGQPCPAGIYIYRIVYESSVAPPTSKTLTGNITLVR